MALAVKREITKLDPRSAPKPATPQPDALFKAFGRHIDDADDAERKLLTELTDFLWTGVYITGVHLPSVPGTSCNSRVRLERLLSKAKEVRGVYQQRLHENGQLDDCDTGRELARWET